VPKATVIISLLTSLNSIIGLILADLWFKGYEVGDDRETGNILLFKLVLIHFITGLIAMTLTLLFMKDKPDTPPSFVQDVKRVDYLDALKQIIKNFGFIRILVSAALFMGPFVAILSVMAFYLDAYGITEIGIVYVFLLFALIGGYSIGGALIKKF